MLRYKNIEILHLLQVEIGPPGPPYRLSHLHKLESTVHQEFSGIFVRHVLIPVKWMNKKKRMNGRNALQSQQT